MQEKEEKEQTLGTGTSSLGRNVLTTNMSLLIFGSELRLRAGRPLHRWFLGLAKKNWPLNQYSMIVADLPVSCVFAIPSL